MTADRAWPAKNYLLRILLVNVVLRLYSEWNYNFNRLWLPIKQHWASIPQQGRSVCRHAATKMTEHTTDCVLNFRRPGPAAKNGSSCSYEIYHSFTRSIPYNKKPLRLLTDPDMLGMNPFSLTSIKGERFVSMWSCILNSILSSLKQECT